MMQPLEALLVLGGAEGTCQGMLDGAEPFECCAQAAQGQAG